MTPQSNFMVAAPVARGQEAGLRALLATMNSAPGMVDPNNALVPFARFDRLHVARFVILHDETLADFQQYGVTIDNLPVWLVFLGDCDGAAEAMLAELAALAGAGLARIFEHCEGFNRSDDLLAWMRAHSMTSATQYVNWVGRTVLQICEEAALHARLRERLKRDAAALEGQSPLEIHRRVGCIRAPGWSTTHAACANATALACKQDRQHDRCSAGTGGAAPVASWSLHHSSCGIAPAREVGCGHPPRPTPDHVRSLSVLEDHDVTNQFSAFGSVKPGWFRLWTLIFIFWVLSFSTRQIYTRGRLARVGTIHFARWVFMDNHRRLLFCSNYDGSLDSYMDDFINKVAYGLNLVFSNGIGYPRTDFLLSGGAKEEMTFKNFLRRHQVPTQVWYKAYPGLTAADLARNTRIREGLESQTMTEAEARRWLAMI